MLESDIVRQKGWRAAAERTVRMRLWPPALPCRCLRPRASLLAVVAVAAVPLYADEQVAAGVRYRVSDEADTWRQAIHVLEIDRDAPGVSLVASVGPGVRGTETVAELARTQPADRGRVLAAINGDFFQIGGEPRYRGTVQGTTIIDGEFVTGPGGGSAFCIDRQGRPAIRPVGGRFELTWPDGTKTPFRVNSSTSDFASEVGAADVVLFTPRFGASTQTTGGRELVLTPTPDSPKLPLRAGQTYAVEVGEVRSAADTPIKPGTLVLSLSTKAAGAASAVQPGDRLRISVAPDSPWADCETAISGDPLLLVGGEIKPPPDTDPPARARRTAIGFGDKRIVLVVTQGYFSHRQMAERLRDLGCTDAMNLDGGGSSTLIVGGTSRVPAPGRGQRPVGNALLVVSRQP